MAMHDLETAGRLNLNNLQSMAPAPTTAAAESAAAILENVEEVTIQNPTTTQPSPNEAGENHSTSLSSDDHASRVSCHLYGYLVISLTINLFSIKKKKN